MHLRTCVGILTLMFCGLESRVWAQSAADPAKPSVSSPAQAQRRPAMVEADRPIRVRGQARNLNMMLMLRGEKDRVKFGEVRQSYVDEVRDTKF